MNAIFKENLKKYYEARVPLMKKAFEKVQNPHDWKEPIEAWIPEEEWDITRDAVIFYTATTPCIVSWLGSLILIRADGYRRGPAGDH